MSGHWGWIDSHVHVFLPQTHEYVRERTYTPGAADIPMLRAHLERITAGRVVIVQPSPYGADNRATLTAVSALGLDRARAVVVIDPATATREQVEDLYRAGARGIRANFKTSGVDGLEAATDALVSLDRVLAGRDLVLEIYAATSLLIKLKAHLSRLGRPIILDHFGGLKVTSPTLEADVDGLLDLLSLPNVVLKASGACRAADYAPDTSSLDPIAPRLMATARGRVIWGSDWPHPGRSSDRDGRPLSSIQPFEVVDDRASLEDLARWSGSDECPQGILRDTPAALFGF